MASKQTNPSPTATEIRAALVPLAGRDVSVTLTTGAIRSVFFGRFHGSDDDRADVDDITVRLDIEGQRLELEVARLLEVRCIEKDADGDKAHCVSIVGEDGATVEIQPDLIALDATL